MSTEHTEPVSHYGDDGHGAGSISAPAQAGETNASQATGGGGSNSGRRRRRRRKGKGPAAAIGGQSSGQPGGSASQGTGEDGGVVSAAAFAPAPAAQATGAPQQGNGQSNGHGPSQNGSPTQNGQNQNGQGQGGGKRKNRKRSGGGGGTGGGGNPQPVSASQNGNGQQRSNRPARANGGWKARSNDGPDGNREGARGGFGSEAFNDNIGNSNGARRKGKFGRGGSGGGPRSFVGPMDHSYRVVNGNIADGPPSTMDYRNANGNANGNVSGRNDSMDFEPAAMLREDAPTRIICFIEDLFVVAKMQETARKLGVKVQFAKAEKESLATLMDSPEGERPSLIVFDLNNAGAKPLTLIPKLKAKLKRGTSIIGFLQHIQGDLKLKAIEAGCDSVMPRSAFSQNLPNLLRRHGFAEEEEMMEA